MKRFLLALVFFSYSLSGGIERTFEIDLSKEFGMDAFDGIALDQLGRSEKTLNIPDDSRYIIKLPSGNKFTFDSYVGSIRTSNDDSQVASRLVLSASNPDYYLTVEEALAVLRRFHHVFGAPQDGLEEWFEPIRQGDPASSFYQAVAKEQYPEVSLELANSFFEEKPVFLVFYLDFDEKTLRKRGVSPETNKVTNLTFDVPAIIDSVRAQNTKVETAQVIKEVPIRATEITPEPAMEEQVAKESDEVAPIEITEEAPEESTNWLLWLIGALVILGGIALVARRKNSATR
jgi:LPXTG-motif cell wall-anchored protein